MTRDPLDPQVFAALLEDVGWPAVEIGVLPVRGRDEWQAVLHRLVGIERHRILLSLHEHLLTATEAGRARWERWHAHDTPPLPALSASELRAQILDRAVVVGDASFLKTIVSALARAPEPVRECVLNEAGFVTVGQESNGWTGSALLMHQDGTRKLRMIVLGPNAGERTVLHECVHRWLAPPPSDDGSHAITVQGEVGLRTLAAAENWSSLAAHDAAVEREDRVCDALAHVWGQ